MDKQRCVKRSYLVVGASGSIGGAVARFLAHTGTSLGLHYHSNCEAVTFLKEAVEEEGAHACCLQADLSSEASCKKLVDEFVRVVGQIDGLAICFGNVFWRSWNELGWQDWMDVFYQHCVAPMIMAQRAIYHMKSHNYGRIVFLSSISPKYAGSSKTLHYAAAKAAVESGMRGLAREVAPLGITVNGVRAGFVLTPQQTFGRNEQEIEERIKKIPVGRAGTPDEIAEAFSFLMSDNASFVTGDIITIAGGD